VLGTEIDRVGRPAINTALTDPFDTLNPNDAGITVDAAKNLYNASFTGPTGILNPTFGPTGDGGFIPWIIGNLAVLDSLDGVCGNQAFCDPDAGSPAKDYGELATLLADDELYVDTTTFLGDTTSSGCGFLGAELEVSGYLSPTGMSASGESCGGRLPTEDVMDIEINALAGSNTGKGLGGLLPDGGFAISNGITSKGGPVANQPNNTTPPFLGTPN
jgi:hypothetical protein